MKIVRWWQRRRAGIAAVKDLLERAEALARADGVERPAAEHLLVAACDHPDGTALAALAAVGRTREQLVDAVDQAHADALNAVGIDLPAPPEPPPSAEPHGVFRSEPSLGQLLRRTHDLATPEGGGFDEFASAWVLVAATEQRHGTVARALDRLGVDREDLREAARRVVHERGPGRP